MRFKPPTFTSRGHKLLAMRIACVASICIPTGAFGVTAPFVWQENVYYHTHLGAFGDTTYAGGVYWADDAAAADLTWTYGNSARFRRFHVDYKPMGSIRKFQMTFEMTEDDATNGAGVELWGLALRSDLGGAVVRTHKVLGDTVEMITVPNGGFGSHPRSNSYTFSLPGRDGGTQLSVGRFSQGVTQIPDHNLVEALGFAPDPGMHSPYTFTKDGVGYRWVHGDADGIWWKDFFTSKDAIDSTVWYGGSPPMSSRITVDIEDHFWLDRPGNERPLVDILPSFVTDGVDFDIVASDPDNLALLTSDAPSAAIAVLEPAAIDSGIWQRWWQLSGPTGLSQWAQLLDGQSISLRSLAIGDYELTARAFDDEGLYTDATYAFTFTGAQPISIPEPSTLIGALSACILLPRRRRHGEPIGLVHVRRQLGQELVGSDAHGRRDDQCSSITVSGLASLPPQFFEHRLRACPILAAKQFLALVVIRPEREQIDVLP